MERLVFSEIAFQFAISENDFRFGFRMISGKNFFVFVNRLCFYFLNLWTFHVFFGVIQQGIVHSLAPVNACVKSVAIEGQCR